MRFPLKGRSTDPFWRHLPVVIRDERGLEHASIRDAPPDVEENHELTLRGELFRFDEIEQLFARHLGDDARLTWSLDVDVAEGSRRRTCALRVDAWRRIAPSAVAGTYPRPSFFLRIAITLEARSVFSHWRIDWEGGLEEALADLRRELGDGAVRCCFFCKWSDYEPSTTTGHLGCFRAVKREYEVFATSSDAWTRKYKKESLHADRLWVDELNVCDEFEGRPHGFGYRG